MKNCKFQNKVNKDSLIIGTHNQSGLFRTPKFLRNRLKPGGPYSLAKRRTISKSKINLGKKAK